MIFITDYSPEVGELLQNAGYTQIRQAFRGTEFSEDGHCLLIRTEIKIFAHMSSSHTSVIYIPSDAVSMVLLLNSEKAIKSFIKGVNLNTLLNCL